jgi:hypothetical protein
MAQKIYTYEELAHMPLHKTAILDDGTKVTRVPDGLTYRYFSHYEDTGDKYAHQVFLPPVFVAL